MFNPYNENEIKDIAPTMSTQCGSTTSSATILILEDEMSGSAYLRNYGSKGKLQNEICDTLQAAMGCGGGNVPLIKNQVRIRKLTPKECWRLMGFKDESFEKAEEVNSNTQLYKQAGNSIVVNVLEKIINNLHLELEHIKLLELFGGIGACSEAMKNLGLDFEIADYVEIDKYACASYNAIHETNFLPQDIQEWDKNIDVDFIMHGSPCQDFSLAGKQAGGDEGSGTRSSLMYETIRIVEKLKPKYVLWENVKNVLGKQHKHNFDNYLNRMSELGYTNYYQVLNAKDYGIPQNRERVFTLSILGDGQFEFPPKEELKIKLKDVLEDSVDEKYYLDDTQVERIYKSTYNTSRTRIQEKDYSQTLCARDWKDPKCVRVGGIFDDEKSTHQAGSIYDKDGLAPTLDTMQGGWRQPCITENTIIDDTFGYDEKPREYENISPTIRSGRQGLKVIENKSDRWSDLD